MGLVAAAVLAQGDMLKSLAMVVLGLLLGIVGSDVDSGVKRFCLGFYELADGIGVVIIAVGVFAVGEIISNLSEPEDRVIFTSRIGSLYPTLQDLKQSVAPIIQGTVLGAFFGYRHLQLEQRFVRCLPCSALRRSWHCLEDARVQPGANAAWFRAGADDGGKPAARLAGLERGSLGIRYEADQPCVYHRYGPDPDRNGVARRTQQAGRSYRLTSAATNRAVRCG